ncbi:MAG: M20/M25/M40 family metallo-hydrolase [Clostridia bacterium]|nr:M20/M25/M40 family metallo-hydrolase [Clostridia bacterium]
MIILYIVLAVIAVLAAVVLIRTAMWKNKPNTNKSVISYTPEEEKKYARFLSEMIKCPTVSLRGNTDLTEFHKLHKVMKELFPLIDERLEKTELEGNLLYRWKGKRSDLDGVLLMGHQDVVTADESGWIHDPFSGDIADGKVHGRGAMDCKCTVMAEWAAVEELLAEGWQPERDIYLACSVNEEIGGTGAPMTAKYLQDKGVRLALVMDEGGAIVQNVVPGMAADCAAVGIVEKGYIDIKFTAKSSGGHSSTPPRNNPMARLAAFMNEVETKRPFKKTLTPTVRVMLEACAPYLSFPLRLILSNLWLFKPLVGPVMPKIAPAAEAFLATTCVFTMCGGSRTPNVIPDEAYVIANLRSSIHQDTDESIEIITKIAKKYNLEYEIIRREKVSDIVDINSMEFSYLKKCVKECFPETCFVPYYITGGTDCRKYQSVSANCLRFTPVRMTNEQEKAMHAVNESINTDAISEGVKFYKYFLKNFPV